MDITSTILLLATSRRQWSKFFSLIETLCRFSDNLLAGLEGQRDVMVDHDEQRSNDSAALFLPDTGLSGHVGKSCKLLLLDY